MSAKAIREYDAKLLVSYWLDRAPLPSPFTLVTPSSLPAPVRVFQVIPDDNGHFNLSPDSLPSWAASTKLVAKPDQLIKRRGKAGLLCLNADRETACKWILERAGKPIDVEGVTGRLSSFIIEPFLPHPSNTEFYVCINSARDGDTILFSHQGGVDVGDVDSHAKRLLIGVDAVLPDRATFVKTLLSEVPAEKHDVLVDFLVRLYSLYVDLHFTYLEINPLVCIDGQNGQPASIHFLDMAAKLDQTAEYVCGPKWAIARDPSVVGLPSAAPSKGKIDRGPSMVFPAPFGRDLTAEEQHIQSIDASTGASLKLTVLNPKGRVWTMVAGGGASVVYSDAIAAHGYAHELANYGEYSGAPNTSQTYEYAKTILDLMTRGEPHPQGKVLIIGGGIANFTNVADTFKGIIKAIKEYQVALKKHDVSIFVRRGGPNYQQGLKEMKLLEEYGIKIDVHGPNTHITHIVPLALGLSTKSAEISSEPVSAPSGTATPANEGSEPVIGRTPLDPAPKPQSFDKPSETAGKAAPSAPQRPWYKPFDSNTRAFVHGLQNRAVQGMLDFDYASGRKTPSVAAIIYPFGGQYIQKFFWGVEEVLVPVYQTLKEAIKKHNDVDTLINFASSRSVFDSTLEALECADVIKSIAIIAEGVPERHARLLLKKANDLNVLIIGPATVGGIKPGCFRIGNTGGMRDNIDASKLYQPGSVAYVSKSGGMSNELNNILSLTTNGTYEGIAIGGDRYPGSTFIDHLLRYEADPEVKLLVLLGEVGGVEEYRVIDAVKSGKINKPVVAWAIGTCASMFTTEVQFGHAGSMANSDLETAKAKNAAMKAAGMIVPDTFEDLPTVLKQTYGRLVADGVIVPAPQRAPPPIPMDYDWALKLGLVRKPAQFISTISNERGEELVYSGMSISEVFEENIGIGGVISLLWFGRRLPPYLCKFLEMCLQLTADHGPAVSGAHNTIVTTRAGKDLVSSLVSGLLTIGDRFGGALDDAAKEFTNAFDSGLTPREFVDSMRKQSKLIPGIGHKIKSKRNPDKRVEIVKEFCKKNFPSTTMLDYALAVEDVTTQKKDTLILNVDGCIAVCICDLFRSSGAFTAEEANEYLRLGVLNGLFVLGRTIGFIGHHIDQKRAGQGLYRHPPDDIHIQFRESSRVVVRPSK